MTADPPDGRVELVAAALCDAEWSHPAWKDATEARRGIYRGEALRLLAKLDAWAVELPARVVADIVTFVDTEAGLRAILDSGDDREARGAGMKLHVPTPPGLHELRDRGLRNARATGATRRPQGRTSP